MKKIIWKEDLKAIEEYPEMYKYASKLLNSLLAQYSEYCTDCSISQFGAIFYLESVDEFDNFSEMELVEKIQENNIEWVKFLDKYCVLCIVRDDIYAINIICHQELYESWISRNREVY